MVKPDTIEKRKNTIINRTRAREMRTNPVAMEKLFWSMVRNRQLAGYKFKRQFPIGPYIADFVCVEEKLIVELDGPFHAGRKSYDEKRDEFLRKKGFRIIRLTNNDFADNAGIALLIVKDALVSGTPSP
jgi:very-short-patch-repair endonuclease